MNDFINHLKNLSQSIDKVDEPAFKSLLDQICKYLNMTFYEVQIEGKPDKKGKVNTLSTWWSNYEVANERQVPIKDEDGYSGQTTYAFEQNKCMWITESNGGPLKNEDAKYVDSWSGTPSNEIPVYWDCEPGKDIKTSIILPLRVPNSAKAFGFINFESEDYLKITDKQKEIFMNIARVVALYIHLGRNKQETGSNAIKNLIDFISEHPEKQISTEKPSVFFAFPQDSDIKVISVIKKCLAEVSDKFKIICWNEINTTGNIDQTIIKDILNCKYGIAYLSQEKKSGKNITYTHNPNVMFEAGMLHTKFINYPLNNGWIPVIEHKHRLPFDLATFRSVIIERDRDNKFITESLTHLLRERIKEWEQ